MDQIIFSRVRPTTRWILATHFIIDTGDRAADLVTLWQQFALTYPSTTIAIAWFTVWDTQADALTLWESYNATSQRFVTT